MIEHDKHLEEMKLLSSKLLSSEEKSREFFKSAGIHDEQGNLAEQYKAVDGWVTYNKYPTKTFINWAKHPSEIKRKLEFSEKWIEKQRTKSLEVQKDKFYSQVGDYLNNKFRGGIHYDSERMVFEVLDTHEQRDEIIEEMTKICTYKL